MLRALDLFCGAGGASMGLHLAGFAVTGVDIHNQPRYPFKFIQADALTYHITEGAYDLIWASPPCQAYSWSTWRLGQRYPELVAQTRRILKRVTASGGIYVIENVVSAPLLNPTMLCGTMFGLKVIRHRNFESNLKLRAPRHPKHAGSVKGGDYVTVAGHGGNGRRAAGLWEAAMQIDWMTRDELTEAIPPAYSEYIGRQLIKRHYQTAQPDYLDSQDR